MSAVLDFPVKPEARDYLACFAADPNEPAWLGERRRQGITRFAELGWPTRRNESWRYLDLQPIQRSPLSLVAPGLPAAMPSDLGFDSAWATMNLLNGRGISVVSRGLPDGIWFHPMRRAITERSDIVKNVAIG